MAVLSNHDQQVIKDLHIWKDKVKFAALPRYKFMITRPSDMVKVYLLPSKADGKYSFVNLTDGHICECKFDTAEDAMNDLNKQKSEGKVISYVRWDLD